ncbi:MAG: Holliday junction branch migration DNA helicase RuvB [Planctomycetes bacterium]|nr:Holliday junction branch migration DNA helicase RuvB [Planctomycetota bacterium]
MVEGKVPEGRVLSAKSGEDEARLDATLRPRNFGEFVGQAKVVENLRVWIDAARGRQEVLDHVLFTGPPGLGKTTLAHLIAERTGAELYATSGPVLEKAGDLAGVLTKLARGDVLFIDEVHALRRPVAEALYSAMEDFRIDVMLGSGPDASSLRLDLARFTLVGATTRDGLLPAPFRSRFPVAERLEPYPSEDLVRVLQRSADLLGVRLEPEAARLLASRSRGTPRVANRFLRRMRDVAQVRGSEVVDERVATEGLRMLGVDEEGLDALDRRVLQCLVRNRGRPVGLKTIAVSVGEEETTIEEVYEPYLIQRGFLLKTPRGRQATERAFAHLGVAPAEPAPAARDLFGS